MSVFARFAPRLQQAIVARLGWSHLRPVQELAGDALLAGDNAVILAPTAGGKTEASMFPAISQMVEDAPSGVGVVYIAPIKALLNNQADRLGLYTEMVALRRFVWHGDTPEHQRRAFLAEPAELLMTTPESLEVMLVSGRVDEHKLFHDLRMLVVDEVHALAGTDRGAHLMSVIERLVRVSRHDVQRVGLSATVGNPDAILSWLTGTSRRPGRVVDPPKVPARRELLVVHRPDVDANSREASRMAKGKKSLFFCQSRAATESVAEHMRRAGTTVFVHHSAVSREERALAEERFYHGSDACIVCTSTLELGIDVGDLDRVLQSEAPDSVSSFLQRMGRTGRREGQSANTTFFCQSSETVLQAIALVELAKAGWVESIEVNDRCWPVLIHQLLAMSLANDGVTAEDAWSHLSQVTDFRGIHRAEFERLVNWMLRDGALRLASGSLVLGPKAERRFGRRNFMELFAVFSSPQVYQVQTAAGQPIGTLTQSFVDRLVDDVSSFLLGGRGWVVIRVQHDDRRVIVEPAPRGRQPSWGGFLPQFLGLEVCQSILRTLRQDEAVPYLEPEAAAALARMRDELRHVLVSQRGGVEFDTGEVRWWTFAGGRINATLRYALEVAGAGWKVVPNNFMLRVQGEGLTQESFRAAIGRLRETEFWEDEEIWTRVARSLPTYRLSKFQPLMPPWVEREMLSGYLLDTAGAWRWLSGGEREVRRLVGPAGLLEREGDALLVPPEAPPALPALVRDGTRELVWVRSAEDLMAAVRELLAESEVGLDVETTIPTQALCLIQIAGSQRTFLIDVLDVEDLEPLRPLLSSTSVTKVIHNARFERGALARYELPIEGVVDTMEESRRVRGRDAEGGHSLRAVCARELGVEIDKSSQRGDWSVRPLSDEQIAYAALDAEVLLRLKAHLA